MKKSFFVAIGLVVNLLMIGTASADYNPTLPQVTDCQISTTAIPETGGQLTVTLHIVDPTPINNVVVNILDNSAHSLAFGVLDLSSGRATDGMWSSNITIAPDLRPGIYNIVAQDIADTSQNSITFYFCPNLTLNYGDATPTPTPKPTPTPTPTPTPSSNSSTSTDSAAANQIADLTSQLNAVKAAAATAATAAANQIADLTSQLNAAKLAATTNAAMNQSDQLARALAQMTADEAKITSLSARVALVTSLQASLAKLNTLVANQTKQLRTICSNKPKPRGC